MFYWSKSNIVPVFWRLFYFLDVGGSLPTDLFRIGFVVHKRVLELSYHRGDQFHVGLSGRL